MVVAGAIRRKPQEPRSAADEMMARCMAFAKQKEKEKGQRTIVEVELPPPPPEEPPAPPEEERMSFFFTVNIGPFLTCLRGLDRLLIIVFIQFPYYHFR